MIRRADVTARTVVMAVLALVGLGVAAYLTSVHYADAAPVKGILRIAGDQTSEHAVDVVPVDP